MDIYKIGCGQILQIQYFGRTELIPPERHGTRYTTEYVMYILLEGKLCLENNTDTVTMLPGDVRIFHKGDFQKCREAAHCIYLYVHFDSPEVSCCSFTQQALDQYWMDRKIRFLQSNPYGSDTYDYSEILLPASFHINDGLLGYVEREFLKHIPCRKEVNYKAALSWAAMEILNTLSREYFDKRILDDAQLSQSSYRIVQEIIRYLDVHFSQSLTGRDLEQQFHINFDYANRLFKKATGVTIFAYKNNLKINRAKLLLTTTNKSVTQIAAEVGYADVFSFSHAFKKAVGVSPAEYANSRTAL